MYRDLQEVVTRLHNFRFQGMKVLVFCKMGEKRSALVLGVILRILFGFTNEAVIGQAGCTCYVPAILGSCRT